MLKIKKSLRLSWMIVATLSLIAFSCDNEETISRQGKISFSFSDNTAPEGGRTKETATPSSILLTIEDASGNVLLENEKLELITFGEAYLTGNIELAVGSYRLTKFIVLDAANAAIYATPVEGSPKAGLVTDPLPIIFNVLENENTSVTPQVISISPNENPSDFGYATFSFEIVDGVEIIPASIKVELTVGEITYLDVNTDIFVTGYNEQNQVAWTKTFSYVGPDANLLPVKAGYHHYSFELNHFGISVRNEINANDLLEGSQSEVPLTYVMTGATEARKLSSFINYIQQPDPTNPESTVMTPQSKVVYEYDGGKISKMKIFGYNNSLGAFEEQRHFIFSYQNGRVSKLTGYQTGQTTHYLEDVYTYDQDGNVSKIAEDIVSDGIDMTVTFSYLHTERLIKGVYRLSNGTGFEYEATSSFGNNVNDKTTRFGMLCNVGEFDHDKKINPLAHLGYIDIFLKNYFIGNRTAESVNYTGCAFPELKPYMYSYEYTQDGYPINATTHYQNTSLKTVVHYFYN